MIIYDKKKSVMSYTWTSGQNGEKGGGEGGVTKREEEQVKSYPYKSGGGGGGRKRFSHAEGGECTKGFGVVLTQELEVLAILNAVEGGTKRFHSLEGALERF